MKISVVLASLIVAATTAHAEPTRYVQTDVMLGGATPVVGPNLLGAVSGGYLLAPALWAHAEIAGGPAADDQGGGSNVQVRGGVEARGCTSGHIACAMAGVDAGALRGTWTGHDMTTYEHVTAAVIVPRIGIDLGGEQWRARLGLELDEAFAGSHTSSFAAASTPQGTIGFELAAGVAYQW